MTSGAALDGPSVVKSIEGDTDQNNVEGKFTSDRCGEKTRPLNSKKRQVGMISTSNPPTKIIRPSVQRIYSPKPVTPPLSPPVWLNRIKKVTPTVLGMKEVARHLLRNKARNNVTGSGFHTILALPTECTYEACMLIDWNKDETLSDDRSVLREQQMDRCKLLSSLVQHS